MWTSSAGSEEAHGVSPTKPDGRRTAPLRKYLPTRGRGLVCCVNDTLYGEGLRRESLPGSMPYPIETALPDHAHANNSEFQRASTIAGSRGLDQRRVSMLGAHG